MATKKATAKKASGGSKKGRVTPNIPRAGLSARGNRYSCGGKKSK